MKACEETCNSEALARHAQPKHTHKASSSAGRALACGLLSVKEGKAGKRLTINFRLKSLRCACALKIEREIQIDHLIS